MSLAPQPEEPKPNRAAPVVAISAASLITAAVLGGLQVINPETTNAVPDVLGTVPGWITSGGIMGILGLLIWWQMGNRKIGVDQQVQFNVDKADIRDHYAEEVSALRARIDTQAANHATRVTDLETRYQRNIGEVEERFARALRDAEERHADCMRDKDGQHDEINNLKDQVAGLRRQIGLQATDRVLELGNRDAPSEDVLASAYRVKDIHEGRSKAGGADDPV